MAVPNVTLPEEARVSTGDRDQDPETQLLALRGLPTAGPCAQSGASLCCRQRNH